MGNERRPGRVLNRGDIQADTLKLRANRVFIMLACNFLWRNVRKRREKVLKLALPPLLHEFNSVFEKDLNDQLFLLVDKARRDSLETYTYKVLSMGASRGQLLLLRWLKVMVGGGGPPKTNKTIGSKKRVKN